MMAMKIDVCRECHVVLVNPQRVVAASEDRITYRYKCPECGTAWESEWPANATDEPSAIAEAQDSALEEEA